MSVRNSAPDTGSTSALPAAFESIADLVAAGRPGDATAKINSLIEAQCAAPDYAAFAPALLHRINVAVASALLSDEAGLRKKALCKSLVNIHDQLSRGGPCDWRLQVERAHSHELFHEFRTSFRLLDRLARSKIHPVHMRRILRDRTIARNAMHGQGRYPDFIVIGAQKCGTTSFYDFIAEHPACTPCIRPEAHFFDKDLNYVRGHDYYRAHFGGDGRTGAHVAFEKTPIYLPLAVARERISRMPAQPGFIVILRHPVDRAWSGFRMGTGSEAASADRFEKKLMDAAKQFEDDATNQETNVFARGLYARQLRSWFAMFPRDQFLILGFDEWIRHSPTALAATERFMGLSLAGLPIPHSRAGNAETLDPAMRDGLSALYRESDDELFELVGRRLY